MSQPLRRAARADRPGFLHLYRAHGAFVRAALRFQGIAREDLEDVQQEVFLAIHRGLPRFKPRLDARGGARGRPLRARRMILARRAGWDPVKAWIYGIVWRVAGHYHERSHRRHEAPSEIEVARALELAEHAQPAEGADEALAREQRDEVLAGVLAEVERERRLILVLHDLLEVPVPRIAEALGLPVSTAQTRLRLAREDLAAAIRRLDRERREALRPGRLMVLGLAGHAAAGAARAAREGVAGTWRWLGERVRRGWARAAGHLARAGGRAGASAATAARGAITVGVGAVLLGAAASHGCAATRAVETRPVRGETAGAVVEAAGSTRGARAPSGFAPATQPAVSAAVVAPPRPFGDEAPAAGLPAITRGRQGSAGAGGSANTQGSADAQGSANADGDAERALLNEALAAFHRGDLDRALDRLITHAARYPRGRFAGSRERLRGRVLTRIAHPTGQPQSLPSPTLRGDRTEHQPKGHYE